MACRQCDILVAIPMWGTCIEYDSKIKISNFAKLGNIRYRCWIICVDMPTLLGKHLRKIFPVVFQFWTWNLKNHQNLKYVAREQGGISLVTRHQPNCFRTLFKHLISVGFQLLEKSNFIFYEKSQWWNSLRKVWYDFILKYNPAKNC